MSKNAKEQAGEPSYSLIATGTIESVRRIDEITRTCAKELALAESRGDTIARGLIAGAAMQQMRELLSDDVMRTIMPIVGTALGIKTDREYGLHQVRDVVLEGMLKGGRVVGNEINILGGNLYLTREYWERRFRELDGVTDVKEPTIGLPRQSKLGEKDYATCQAILTYRLDGKLRRLECKEADAITVIWNRTDRLETIQGKIKKRLFAMAFAEVSGMPLDLDDEPAGAFVDVAAEKVEPMDALEHARRSMLAKISTAKSADRLDDMLAQWEQTESELGATFDARDLEVARAEVVKAYRERKLKINLAKREERKGC